MHLEELTKEEENKKKDDDLPMAHLLGFSGIALCGLRPPNRPGIRVPNSYKNKCPECLFKATHR